MSEPRLAARELRRPPGVRGRDADLRPEHLRARLRPYMMLASLALAWPTGCQCSSGELVEVDSEGSSGTFEETLAASSGSGDESTGEPFDASRWIGRYHFESTFLPFGESGYPGGNYTLTNFEILPDSRATMLHDHCNYKEPITIEYQWLPSENGWLILQPGAGERSLRFNADPDVESLRVRLIEPCRELEFDYDGTMIGMGRSFTLIRPGASCWVDKCTTGSIMQVDYCDGEQPEDVCP
ncbi:hypothetical protein [Paraliomyxa miuraensis]|uniref:hypothetical protein n=1 Tax=Paraliomyxa miuraensis TaxID=376150 RepID=UPI00225ACE61|nr:hypothetical protein [Paraliomyxa miuraensis]MCX4246749.1 hypothetical protein [Paraliomyxa miuraensis]